MKREELKVIDLLCDMGIDVNGQRNLQPWKAYDIDEVNLVIKELEAENERLKGELKQTEAHDKIVIDGLRKENERLEGEQKGLLKENAKLKCLSLHAMCKWLDSWSICVGINIMTHRKFGLFKQIKRHLNYYSQAYRKAKKALREGK